VGYIVVDTGPWIFGKKVMLPAGVFNRIDAPDGKVYVDRTKDEFNRGAFLLPPPGRTSAKSFVMGLVPHTCAICRPFALGRLPGADPARARSAIAHGVPERGPADDQPSGVRQQGGAADEQDE
jgi:hypothetical protein